MCCTVADGKDRFPYLSNLFYFIHIRIWLNLFCESQYPRIVRAGKETKRIDALSRIFGRNRILNSISNFDMKKNTAGMILDVETMDYSLTKVIKRYSLYYGFHPQVRYYLQVIVIC